ncbi:MAG: DUF2332 family protein [Pseudomonadota bacterium]
MTPALREAFAYQAKSCEALGSPFMARMLPLVPDALPGEGTLAQRLNSWDPARLGPSQDSIPLRIAGGLHLLHLKGAAPTLSASYPPNEMGDDTLTAALSHTFADHEPALLKALDNPPQTNEVRRAAFMIALGHWLTARYAKPLVVSEVGASAGLNLNWDFFCLQAAGKTLGPQGSPVQLAPEWRGTPPTPCPAYVAEARGVDLMPIDVANPDEALRLQSYLWPDQADRLARTRAAIDLFLAPDTEAQLDAGDALDWLPARLAPRPGHLHLIYSTIAWQYLPEAAQQAGEAMIRDAGAKATDDAPLAWGQMEPDGTGPGAALTLRLWPGDIRIPLGRMDFHGRWIDWQAPDPRIDPGL